MTRLRWLLVWLAAFGVAGVWAVSVLAVPPELARSQTSRTLAEAGRALAGASYQATYEGTFPDLSAATVQNEIVLAVGKSEVTGRLWWRSGDAISCSGVSIEIGPGGVALTPAPKGDPNKQATFAGKATATGYYADKPCPPNGATVPTPSSECLNLDTFGEYACFVNPHEVEIVNGTISDGAMSGQLLRQGESASFSAERTTAGENGDEESEETCRAPSNAAAKGCPDTKVKFNFGVKLVKANEDRRLITRWTGKGVVKFAQIPEKAKNPRKCRFYKGRWVKGKMIVVSVSGTSTRSAPRRNTDTLLLRARKGAPVSYCRTLSGTKRLHLPVTVSGGTGVAICRNRSRQGVVKIVLTKKKKLVFVLIPGCQPPHLSSSKSKFWTNAHVRAKLTAPK